MYKRNHFYQYLPLRRTVAATAIFILFQLMCVNSANAKILGNDNCIQNAELKHKPSEGWICQCKAKHCLIEKPEGKTCKRKRNSRVWNHRKGNGRCTRFYVVDAGIQIRKNLENHPNSPKAMATPLSIISLHENIEPITIPPPIATTQEIKYFFPENPETPKEYIHRSGRQGPLPEANEISSKAPCVGWGCRDDYDYSDEDITFEASPVDLWTSDDERNLVSGQNNDLLVFGIQPVPDIEPLRPLAPFPNQANQILMSAKIASLPKLDKAMTIKEENCLKTNRVYWPHDDRCYSLLQQGPCNDDEWLTLNDEGALNDNVTIACSKRPCPCRRADSYLCEVLIPKKVVECGSIEKIQKSCHVAMAAEQDGICEKGQQIIVTPFGDGVCGCIINPPHMTLNGDVQCYPLFEQGGPCLENESLQFSPKENQTVCTPTLCKPGFVLYEDGKCYMIDTQGPCDDMSKLGIDPKSHTLQCIRDKKSIQRSLWGLFPGVRGN